MKFRKELLNNQTVLSVFGETTYSKSLYSLLHSINGQKICYVTLNKTAASLQRALKLDHIHTKDIFFIDAVAEGIGKKNDDDNVLTVTSPAALNELSIAVSNAMKSGYFDVVIFDSLSTLQAYHLGQAAEHFTNKMINKIKADDKHAIFTCLNSDMESQLIKNSCLTMDKVIMYSPSKHHNARNSLTLPALVAGAVMSLTLFGGSNQVTGAVIGQNTSIGWGATALLLAAVIIAGLVLYKRHLTKPITVVGKKTKDVSSFKKQASEKMRKWAQALNS